MSLSISRMVSGLHRDRDYVRVLYTEGAFTRSVIFKRQLRWGPSGDPVETTAVSERARQQVASPVNPALHDTIARLSPANIPSFLHLVLPLPSSRIACFPETARRIPGPRCTVVMMFVNTR